MKTRDALIAWTPIHYVGYDSAASSRLAALRLGSALRGRPRLDRALRLHGWRSLYAGAGTPRLPRALFAASARCAVFTSISLARASRTRLSAACTV